MVEADEIGKDDFIAGLELDDVTAFRVAAAHEARFPWLDQPSRRPAL